MLAPFIYPFAALLAIALICQSTGLNLAGLLNRLEQRTTSRAAELRARS
jgi:hypothetical protein